MIKLNKYKFITSVYIGRFQPFHYGHLKTIIYALKQSKKLIIVLGSYRLAPSLRSPWSASERIEMIKSCLNKSQLQRIYFVKVRDRLYNEEMWINNVKGEVLKITGNNESIAIIGHEKDSSSYYLKVFPYWTFLETGNYKGLNSTAIRNQFFLEKKLKLSSDVLPVQVIDKLKKYRATQNFKELKNKFEYVERAKTVNNNVFPNEICNSLVYCQGYILLVISKNPLRRGLLSLPEAQVSQNENYKECSIRGLMDETNISITYESILASYKNDSVFKNSERYLICKEISFTYFFKLNEKFLPNICPSKSVEAVEWVLIDDLYLLENKFYGDHFQIIQWFLRSIKE